LQTYLNLFYFRAKPAISPHHMWLKGREGEKERKKKEGIKAADGAQLVVEIVPEVPNQCLLLTLLPLRDTGTITTIWWISYNLVQVILQC